MPDRTRIFKLRHYLLADLEGRLVAMITLHEHPLRRRSLAAVLALPVRSSANDRVGGLLAMRADEGPSLRGLLDGHCRKYVAPIVSYADRSCEHGDQLAPSAPARRAGPDSGLREEVVGAVV
jgi:hypothetical protein